MASLTDRHTDRHIEATENTTSVTNRGGKNMIQLLQLLLRLMQLRGIMLKTQVDCETPMWHFKALKHGWYGIDNQPYEGFLLPNFK